MSRAGCLVLFLAVGFGVAVSPAAGNPVPYPPYCTVLPADAINGIVLAPDSPSPIPMSVQTITIRGQSNNPMPDALVQITPGQGIVTCPNAVHQGQTDEQGRVIITLSGGGCMLDVANACEVRANGIIIRQYRNAKSPDFDGAGGNLRVDLGDAIELGRERAGSGERCHDEDNDGDIDLIDIMVFSSAFSPAHVCR